MFRNPILCSYPSSVLFPKEIINRLSVVIRYFAALAQPAIYNLFHYTKLKGHTRKKTQLITFHHKDGNELGRQKGKEGHECAGT